MLSSLFFEVLCISNKSKESYFQFAHWLCRYGWKCEEKNKEAHKTKSEDFEEVWTLDDENWNAEIVLYCGYEDHKCKVFDWDMVRDEEKLHCETYRYERECYPHL